MSFDMSAFGFGAAPTPVTPDNDLKAFKAANGGDLETLKRLVSSGAKANPVVNGLSSFHAACKKGHRDVVIYLLESDNAALMSATADGKTALHLAAANGNLSILEGVTSMVPKAELNDFLTKPAAGGFSALHMCAHSGNLNCVKFLVEVAGQAIGSLDSHLTEEGQTMLHLSAVAGKLASARYLVESAGMNISTESALGMTAAMKAAYAKNEDILKYFMQKDEACVKDATPDLMTPLHFAAMAGCVGCVELLANSRFVDVNSARTKSGQLALHKAAFENRLEVVQLLLRLTPASAMSRIVNSADNEGRTPLMMAASGGARGAALFLATLPQVDILREDAKGSTAADFAVKTGYKELSSRLTRLYFIQVLPYVIRYHCNAHSFAAPHAVLLYTRRPRHRCSSIGLHSLRQHPIRYYRSPKLSRENSASINRSTDAPRIRVLVLLLVLLGSPGSL
jgi:ankyrin repeat protein